MISLRVDKNDPIAFRKDALSQAGLPKEFILQRFDPLGLIVIADVFCGLEVLKGSAGPRIDKQKQSAPMNIPIRVQKVGESSGIHAAPVVMERQRGLSWINPSGRRETVPIPSRVTDVL